MSDHRDVGPELQQLAKTIVELIDPLIQAGATAFASTAGGGTPGKCTQTWCPLCAGAAVVAGESHPLASMIAQHGAALLAQLRAAARDEPSDVADVSDAPPDEPSRYQPIPITIDDER